MSTAAVDKGAAAGSQAGKTGSQAGSSSGSSSSNLPVQQECKYPGRKSWVMWRTTFIMEENYVPIKAIGKGAYGVVCSAKNTVNNEKVAVKKIGNAFENLIDARRTLREIKLLRHLHHDNLIALKDMLHPVEAREKYNDVYLVYELMDTDLHQIIRSSQTLTNEHHQYFIYQILRGLKFLHTANVLHRDLKPSNLLLNASCDLKICDFGLARTSAERNFMTEYVVTRWYRAPELLLSCGYSTAIDIWSVGCILGELLGRKPLLAGEDYVDQLKRTINLLGQPTDDDLSFIESQKARAYIRALPPGEKVNFRKKYPEADPLAIDLMEKMLQFDPRKRIDVHAALKHPWLAQLHDEACEPSAPSEFSFPFEEDELTQDKLREMVYDEMLEFHKKK